MIPSVAVIVFDIPAKKVLLVKHKEHSLNLKGKISLPGGQILNRENTNVAIEKLLQETGLETSRENIIKLPFKYEALIDRVDGTKKDFSMITFLCTSWKGDLIETGEDAPFWVELDKLNELDLLPNVATAIFDAAAFEFEKK